MIITKKEDENWPNYWPGKLTNEQQEEYCSNPYIKIDDETLHIGQCYENEAAKIIQCKICGGKKFNVGQGEYFAAIRCVECHWEVSIHDG